MRIGLCPPQGYFNEYDGWDPVKAWKRTLEVSRARRERLGFEIDLDRRARHLEVGRPGLDGVRRLGDDHRDRGARARTSRSASRVVNSTFRNPALTAKMAATLDVITEGRVVLGLGAGFRQIEADTFGFDYPSLGERLAILGEHFEIVTRALNHDEPPFSFEGKYARVKDLDNAAARRPPAAGEDHGRRPRPQGHVPAGRQVRRHLQPRASRRPSSRRCSRCSARRASGWVATPTRSSCRAASIRASHTRARRTSTASG